MNRTRILIALLVLVVLIQLFPGRAKLIKTLFVSAGAVYVAAWAGARYRHRRRQLASAAAQAAADTTQYRQYEQELHSLRAKHGATDAWTDSEAIPQEYKKELTALLARHQDLLDRRFGPRR